MCEKIGRIVEFCFLAPFAALASLVLGAFAGCGATFCFMCFGKVILPDSWCEYLFAEERLNIIMLCFVVISIIITFFCFIHRYYADHPLNKFD